VAGDRQTLSDFFLVFIAPTPRINNGSLQVAIIVINSQGRVFSGTNILSEIEDSQDDCQYCLLPQSKYLAGLWVRF